MNTPISHCEASWWDTLMLYINIINMQSDYRGPSTRNWPKYHSGFKIQTHHNQIHPKLGFKRAESYGLMNGECGPKWPRWSSRVAHHRLDFPQFRQFRAMLFLFWALLDDLIWASTRDLLGVLVGWLEPGKSLSKSSSFNYGA